jgi:hypothetical protein
MPPTAVWQRTIDANIGYARAVGSLVAGYTGALSALARRSAPTRRIAVDVPLSRAQVPLSRALSEGPRLVLQGETAAGGAFVVENKFDHPVEAVVVASPFVAASGASIFPRFAFDPAVVKLEPGEQAVVRAAVDLDDSVADGTDYGGQFAIEGLAGTTVPVTIRRLRLPSSV